MTSLSRTEEFTSQGRVVKGILKNNNPRSVKYPDSVLKVSELIQEARKICQEKSDQIKKMAPPACIDTSIPVSKISRADPQSPTSPTSPSVANGHHTCGSVFAKCSEFGRTSLLQTFSDVGSPLYKDTFSHKSEAKQNGQGVVKTEPKQSIRKLENTEVIQNEQTQVEPANTVYTYKELPDRMILEPFKPLRRHNSLPDNRLPVESLSDVLGMSRDKVPVSLFEILSEKSPEKRRERFRGRSYSEYHSNGEYKGLSRFSKRSGTPVIGFEHPEVTIEQSNSSLDVEGQEDVLEDVPFCKVGADRLVDEFVNGRSYSDGSYPENSEDVIEYLQSLVHRLKKDAKEWERKAEALESEWLLMRRQMKKKDEDNLKLRTENHKLKYQRTRLHGRRYCLQSVLLQKNSAEQKDLLSSLQDSHGMPGQTQPVTTAVTSANKKQGVSAESFDHGRSVDQIHVQRYDKDFRSRQLIKDAIMDNDFLENLDASQIRELVDCMFLKEFLQDSYVIREGEAGSHLYVSAEGELEVIKEEKILGRMGPGKAFGELAILYNCQRTASITVVSDRAKVWALDRRVFQQIMMRAVKQRLEEKMCFLRSVPLLHKLNIDLLTKIADALELEFYPSGAHIIHQGATGDTFFIISEGQVKVTQRTHGRRDEEEIRVLGKGDYFGEQALLKEEHRTASVIALSPGVECLTLARDSFFHLIGDLSELHEKDYGDEIRGISRHASSVTLVDEEEYDYIRLDDLDVIGTLGVGGFGRVELVQYVYDKSLTFALKCLKKQHIVDTQQQAHVHCEKKIMMSCNSPFVCRLYRTFRDSKYVYMLLEACLGGEVWTILRDKGYFDDNATKFVMACVVEALDYLHRRGIIYRDLKPENLLLDNHGYVKIADMGFSKIVGYNKTWTFCGTPEYVAPEVILNKGHDRAVDYWALGVLLHELLTGKPPFTAPDPMKTYIIILKGIEMVKFPKHVTRSAQNLMKKLCRDSPSERLGYQRGGVQDIKAHKWFQGFDWDSLQHRTLVPPIMPQVSAPTDLSNFDSHPKLLDVAPDEFSDWDCDF